MNIEKLVNEIIAGRRLSRNDEVDFLESASLVELTNGADRLREHFIGNHVDLCTIIAGKSGN